MRDPSFYASGLVELHELSDASERRATWRQSMAALGRATAEKGPGPLEGLHPEALLKAARCALNAGLADELDWLAPGAAGAALYELASALPLGAEQRELGRRVFARLVAGDAGTFVAIAHRMVLGNGKGLGSAGMRARIALVTELPICLGVADGPLAIAIASRRDLAREWIALPSTGSLSSRRLAARLLERAAREAARRAACGDDHSLRTFGTASVAPAWHRLLADRESLVWRHVAVARGLLAPWVPELAADIQAALDPSLSATEWRRAAASMAANVAVDPDGALLRAKSALSNGLMLRDPGVSSAFIWGLVRSVEAEPQAAEELLDEVLERAGPEIAEAVTELRAELGDEPLALRAVKRALALLSRRSRGVRDDGDDALALEVARDLEGAPRANHSLRYQVAAALQAFATAGAKEAYARAHDALEAAREMLDALEASSPEEEDAEGAAGAFARRTSLAALRDLDLSLLERDVLARLLLLGGGGDVSRSAQEALDPLHARLATWIIARERSPLLPGVGGVGEPRHTTVSLRRLRALLHLVDSDMGDEDADPQRAARLRMLGLRSARALLDRFERGPPSPLRRTIVAALARSLDALVRVGACDLVDALLIIARHVADPVAIGTLAEASMAPDLIHVLAGYARFAQAATANAARALPAYEELTRDLAPDTSGRTEALRTVLVRLGNALNAANSATSVRALAAHGEPEVISQLEVALASLVQLSNGARARFDPDRTPTAPPPPAPRPLTLAITKVLSGAASSLRKPDAARVLDELLAGVPKAIGLVVAAVVGRLVDLPLDAEAPIARASARPSVRAVTEALPAWVPARRTLGGFYLLRALSSGAVGSVFVVSRDEERGDANAEKFALKVPEYSAGAARQLSELEFLKMFRDEASTLIALPQHPNLARFVTFDAGTRPKPILVMELVEGLTLERRLETGDMDMRRAFRVLGDILCGLEAMHAVAVGHLDLKPSNVVLRRGEEAVLVDFGLAGRHIRPGCATGPYGAPEVWGALDASVGASPAKADIYAFGCVAFETLVGRVLFDAPSEIAQVALHVGHDGFPVPLRAVADHGGAAPLVELLFSTLRRNPKDRPSAATVRAELSRLAPAFERAPWPIAKS